MQAAGFRLGIDFGTSHTVAVLRWPDGRAKPLLCDGSPLLPSAVYAEPAGGLAVGRDALHSARLDPARFEPNPKRRIDEGTVLLGDREVAVVELVAAVLGRVTDEVRRTAGGIPSTVTLSCPATWGTARRRVLGAAAARAGLGEVGLVEEPVAAATYFARVLGHRMAAGSVVVVYDLGGGTFDVSLVERTADGFRTLLVDGRDDFGGLDLDDALVRRVGDLCRTQDPAAWGRLSTPATADERRQRRLLWDDVRGAKERLSRHNTAELHVPGVERSMHLTREEFEALARPLLAETVSLTANAMYRSGTPPERVAGVFLVGGSSRIPLVYTMVHRGLQIAPTVIEQPELVVAEGSVLTQAPTGGGPTVVATAPPPSHPVPTSPAPVSPPPAPASPPVSGPPPTNARPPVSGPPLMPAPPLATVAQPVAATRPFTAAAPPVITPAPPTGEGSRGRRRVLYAVVAVLAVGALVAAGFTFWPDLVGGGDGGERPSDARPDLLYDGSKRGREVVLLGRDGTRATLPSGGAIKSAIAVPNGWVLARIAADGTDSGQFVNSSGRLLQQQDRIDGMYVNASGTRAAAYLTEGKIRVWDLTANGDAITETRLPEGVRAVGWVGDRVLVRVRGTGPYTRHDYWDPALGEYTPESSDLLLVALGGREDGRTLVALTERDGKPCLIMVDTADGFRPTGGPVCDGPVRLSKVDSGDVLPLVSPDGRTLLARASNGDTAVFAVDDVMRGAAKATVLRSFGDAPVARVSWAVDTVFVQIADRYFRCPMATGACAAHEPSPESGLAPTRLVVRFPP